MQSEFLTVAIKAVKEAEKIILRYLNENVRAELKADQSPVTIADKEAEAIIRQTILAHFPDHTFFGEEGEKVELRNHQGFTWIVDPIDGTKSYLRKNPLFATQLALMHDGEFIIGVSNAPMLGELVYAEKGKGCFLNEKPVRVSDVAAVKDAYMSFGSLKYFEQTNNLDALVQLSADVRWARGIGDFWSYHLLIQGKLEIMIEPVTKLWDIAAMAVIVDEAGGKLTQLDGSAIAHDTTTALATNGVMHDQIVTRFSKYKDLTVKKMQFKIKIQANKEKVWNTLWQDKTFRQWAGIIDPGTYMVGELKEGREVQFISAENGYGVTSLVAKLVPNESLLFKHRADTKDSGAQERDKEWSGGEESYNVVEENGATILYVTFDVPANLEAYFSNAYPKALDKVKELAEQS